MKRLATLILLGACGAAAIPAAAPAASYDITVCRSAPGNVNHAFLAINDAPTLLDATDNCAGTEDATGGLYASEKLGAGSTPTGDQVRWRMSAPAGLKITRLRGWAYVRNGTDDTWTPFFRTAEGSVLLTCEIVPGDGLCSAGFVNYFGNDPSEQDWAMNTTALEFGVSCDAGGASCINGSSFRRGLATLFGATITVTDSGAPTIANVTGDLVAGGTLSGSKSVAFDAADASGIAAVRLYVDGTQRASSSETCDYTYARPCADVSGASLTLETTQLADGTHSVQVAAVDAAGNEQRSTPVTITVNNAPPPPSGGGGGGGGAPAGGGGGGGGGSPTPAPTPSPAPTPAPQPPPVVLPPVVAPRPELHAAKVRVRDTLWHDRTLQLRGTITSRASGKVTITVRARGGKRTLRAHRSATIKRGHWSTRVRFAHRPLELNKLLVVVHYAGDRDVSEATVRRRIYRSQKQTAD